MARDPNRSNLIVEDTPVSVTLQRSGIVPTPDQALWRVIRSSADSLGFENYVQFIEPIMGGAESNKVRSQVNRVLNRSRLPFPDVEPYRLLKVATEVFMMRNAGVASSVDGDPTEPSDLYDRLDATPGLADEIEERLRMETDPASLEDLWQNDYLKRVDNDHEGPDWTLPYLYDVIHLKLGDVPVGDKAYGVRQFYGILRSKLTRPVFLELLWNYWMEEGMLVQTMNAISWRFQNRRGPTERDPLAMLEIDPLRGLNNLMWGWVQDEEHRLTIARRAYEYDHEYGIRMMGKAVPQIRTADSRSRFLEGFHTLLSLACNFYREDDDTTVVADGFPVLKALRDVHLTLTQGAHNQYGDLPWTSRQEFLMQQWIIARPEMRDFLPRRIMVDYPEGWMDTVESMKNLQGWTDTSILHFRDLALFGEKILLSIRFGAWTSEIHPENAANWARYWRPEVQGYIHAYRSATGVDLTNQPDATMPSVLLQQRLPARPRATATPLAPTGVRRGNGTRPVTATNAGARTNGARATTPR